GGERLSGERGPEVNRLAHRQLVDHDVDRPPGGRGEIHLLVAAEIDEPAVWLAAGRLQVGRDLLALLGKAREVDVLVTAQPGWVLRAQDPDGQAAQELEPEPGARGAAGQRQRL